MLAALATVCVTRAVIIFGVMNFPLRGSKTKKRTVEEWRRNGVKVTR
jgi:hypothetical protein